MEQEGKESGGLVTNCIWPTMEFPKCAFSHSFVDLFNLLIAYVPDTRNMGNKSLTSWSSQVHGENSIVLQISMAVHVVTEMHTRCWASHEESQSQPGWRPRKVCWDEWYERSQLKSSRLGRWGQWEERQMEQGQGKSYLSLGTWFASCQRQDKVREVMNF